MKYFTEVEDIRKACPLRNLRNGQVRLRQQLLRPAQAQQALVFLDGPAHRVLKQRACVFIGQAAELLDLLRSKPL